jgi:type IV pilus assembly protein PilP
MKTFVFLLMVMLVFPGFLYAEEDKQAQSTGLQEEAVSSAEIVHVYDPGGRRDPFIPLVDVSRGQSTEKESPRVLGTLESYDIPDFKVLAIVEKGKGKYTALLLAPDNKSFIIKEGSVIGLYKGEVKKMYKDKIIVLEHLKDYKGELIPRQTVLELYEGGVE